MGENKIHYTKVREYVWQIEDKHVYCTLVKGSKLAILWDTGYGEQDLKSFVDAVCDTPYIVINSHGHPDHCVGDAAFETVYAPKAEWDVMEHFINEEPGIVAIPNRKEIAAGQEIDLGGIHVKVIAMEGHTKGSIGLLLKEDRLLLSGDAINGSLWMFNYGVLPLDKLYTMLLRLEKEPFDTFLCGHYDKELSRSQIEAHKKNLETLVFDPSTEKEIFGITTYESTYKGEEGTSTIIYDKELLSLEQRKRSRLTTIYFVRHAEPVYGFEDDRMQPLTKEGQEDSRQVVTALKDVELDYVISSPYRRSMDTIRFTAAAHGLVVKTDERFRERDKGFESNNYGMFQKRWADFEYHEKDGESIGMVQRRNIEGIQELLKEHMGERILFGTHGTALSSILNYYDSSYNVDGFLRMINFMPYIIRLSFIGDKCMEKEELLIVKKQFKGLERADLKK